MFGIEVGLFFQTEIEIEFFLITRDKLKYACLTFDLIFSWNYSMLL